jgi:hypothetical protein
MRNWLRRFLIPTPENNFRPDFLERFSVGIMLVLILLSFTMANLQALLWIGSDWLVSTILPAVIVELTNEERDSGSLTELVRNPLLDAAATLKAQDMAKNSYFAHYSPAGVSPWYWFDTAGYNYLHAGENLAVHFTESGEVVDAWMKSPSHRANIMNGQYREIGVGTAKGEYKGYPTIFVVQLFGTPRQVAAATPDVAGASEDNTPSDITVEKVAISPEPDVAPATVETIPPNEEVVPEPAMEPVPAESIVLTTDLATTSREGEPAPVVPATTDTPPDTSLPLRSATESSLWLSILYAVLASTVVISLLTSMVLEWRRHHPVQIAYAGGLLAVMALLLYIHTNLTGGVTIV